MATYQIPNPDPSQPALTLTADQYKAILQPQIDDLLLRASSFSVDLANQLAALNATMAVVQADIDSQADAPFVTDDATPAS